MKFLASVLGAYTALMLLVHLTSWKLLRIWSAPGESGFNRLFSVQTALRVEALYWILALVSWPLWPSAAWKAVVLLFAMIHLGVWLAGERHSARSGGIAPPPPQAHRFIVAFDLVEACALAAIVWLAAFRALHAA